MGIESPKSPSVPIVKASERRSGLSLWIGGSLLFGLGLAVGIPKFMDWKHDQDPMTVYKEMVRPLYCGNGYSGEGFWVGDVAELYRMGQISRQLAQADTAPLNPLVAKPVPFHGYYVRVMESGPPMTMLTDDPTPFKGVKYAKSYAFCIYPAEAGTPRYSWVISPFGVFRKYDAGNQPQLAWFTIADRRVWAIVD